MNTSAHSSSAVPRSVVWIAALGLYLTLEGYHARDGDQAYRLPLLARFQDPRAFENDPFVDAVAQFNPHRGYLAFWISRVGRWAYRLVCLVFSRSRF